MTAYRYMTMDDRRKIENWHRNGDRPKDIAERLSVHVSTIYHELRRGYTGNLDQSKKPVYSAEVAQENVQSNFRRRGKRSMAG